MEMFLALHPMEFYISQVIIFARASSHVADFNTRNLLLTQKLLKQGYWYHNHHRTFLNFTVNTMIGYPNSILDLNLSCARACRNQVLW